VFLIILELIHRGGNHSVPVHVVNVEITDNREEAAVGARHILNLIEMVMNSNLQDRLKKQPIWMLNLIKFYKSFLKNLIAVYYIPFLFTKMIHFLNSQIFRASFDHQV
jgi:hypothetical protein